MSRMFRDRVTTGSQSDISSGVANVLRRCPKPTPAEPDTKSSPGPHSSAASPNPTDAGRQPHALRCGCGACPGLRSCEAGGRGPLLPARSLIPPGGVVETRPLGARSCGKVRQGRAGPNWDGGWGQGRGDHRGPGSNEEGPGVTWLSQEPGGLLHLCF